MGRREQDGQQSLRFRAGDLRFDVAVGPDLRSMVTEMFAGLDVAESGDANASFEVLREDRSGHTSWRLYGPNAAGMLFEEPSVLLDALVSAVNLTALDADPSALHLHASAASRDGDAVVIVGESGSGKTTLVANLAASGWKYVTDEMVRVAPGSPTITGFAKPLSLRTSSLDLVAAASMTTAGPLPGATIQMSPIGLGLSVAAEGRPVVILCTHPAVDRRGVEPRVTRIAPADAVVRMMSQSMDATRFGEGALLLLAQLAARCECYDLDVGDPTAMVALVSELMDHPRLRPVPVDEMPRSGRIAEGVSTVFIGDGAVIGHAPTGAVIALDAPGCLVWKRLADLDGVDDVDLNGPVESSFVAQLASLGLLDAPPEQGQR